MAHLEVQALGNIDPHIHFAILSDFPDAPTETLPHDAEILDAARAGIAALNARHANGDTDRFFLFHRLRQWNERERLWMGWERKRGKIEEFNRLLRGATDTSFAVSVGDLTVLPQVRYCITLDSDTRLPRGVARELIGIIIHPLNRATFNPQAGRVTEGYGILQPRISVTFMSAAGSLFARLYSGHTGVDPYTTAVSDTYQDLFGEGIFTGKGLYDVDAFTASLEGSVPENALLSHDLFEGLHARVALASDVELVDDYPSSVLSHARRQHRWVRGDWQILFWLFPFVPSQHGLKRNPVPLIGRWKIFDNLRRSLVSPTLLMLLVAGWTVLPGARWLWTMAAIGVTASQLLPVLGRLLVGPGRAQSIPVFVRNLRRDAVTALAQVFLSVMFLAFHAWDAAHAIGVTLVRLVLTKRRMLEWETAATTAARAAGLIGHGVRGFVAGMAASPIIAGAIAVAILAWARDALPSAALFLVLWTIAPVAAYWLSVPVGARVRPLSDRERRMLRRTARKTWRYFETFVTEADAWLAPDNYQADANAPKLARRTSPTNIGMSLLSTLAAHDLGYLSTDDRGSPRERNPGDARRARAVSGTLPELVRHVEPGTAASTLCVDRGQRQPRRRNDGPRARASGDRRPPADARAAACRTGRRSRSARRRVLVERRAFRSAADRHRDQPCRSRPRQDLRSRGPRRRHRRDPHARDAARQRGSRVRPGGPARFCGRHPLLVQGGARVCGGAHQPNNPRPRSRCGRSPAGCPRSPMACGSTFCTTDGAVSFPLGTVSPTPTGLEASTPPSTTCWRRKRGWPVSWPSSRETFRSTTGFISDASSRT